MSETPRLSTFIRAFGHVSHPDDKFLEEDEKKDFEILKRRILAKRKAEEERPSQQEEKVYFGSKIPFNPLFFEPNINDDAFKCLSRPDPSQFLLRNQINFDFKELQSSDSAG